MTQADVSRDINTRIMFRAIDLILSWPEVGESEQQPQGAADDGAAILAGEEITEGAVSDVVDA